MSDYVSLMAKVREVEKDADEKKLSLLKELLRLEHGVQEGSVLVSGKSTFRVDSIKLSHARGLILDGTHTHRMASSIDSLIEDGYQLEEKQ